MLLWDRAMSSRLVVHGLDTPLSLTQCYVWLINVYRVVIARQHVMHADSKGRAPSDLKLYFVQLKTLAPSARYNKSVRPSVRRRYCV